MVFKIIIKPIVFTDAEEAVAYYESKSKGLGERFYKTFLNSIENIKEKPFTYSYVFKTVRRHLLSKFPIRFTTLF